MELQNVEIYSIDVPMFAASPTKQKLFSVGLATSTLYLCQVNIPPI
jgi:hypothetical protein